MEEYQKPMLKDGSLEDKVIVVTGGGSGLGKAMATYFLELGARVAITSREMDKLLAVNLELDEKTGGYSARGNKIVTNTPMGKFGDPDDLQGATLYLLSDISSFVTGIVIPVDGGFNAYSGV